MFSHRTFAALAALVLSFACCAPARADDKPPAKPEPKKETMIAGKAEVLRSVPKRFARLKAIDANRRTVTLLIEGESLAKVWTLTPDAEIKVHGWWGRLDQFKLEDRLWVWFHLNRDKQPVGVLMLADELSEQDIHGPGLTVESHKGTLLTVKSAKGEAREVKLALEKIERGAEKAPVDSLKAGEHIYLQTSGDQVRQIVDPTAFEALRERQRLSLRQRWLDQGLPGSVMFLHLSGEMEFMMDHEAMRWGRALKPGDRVTLQTTPPIPAQVQQVRPWRERTQVRMVVAGADLADLQAGQRVHLRVPTPSEEVERSALPPDLGRLTGKEERVEWFLASIYCTCKVKGDGCTGDFYSLASCNPNACGMPNRMRQVIAARIEKGLTDKQIFEELLKEQGPELLRPHLLP